MYTIQYGIVDIVDKFDREMQALEGVRLLRQEAERRIEQITTEAQ